MLSYKSVGHQALKGNPGVRKFSKLWYLRDMYLIFFFPPSHA